jgi:hypothetical protein
METYQNIYFENALDEGRLSRPRLFIKCGTKINFDRYLLLNSGHAPCLQREFEIYGESMVYEVQDSV